MGRSVFADRLKSAREQAGLTLDQAGEGVGRDGNTVWRWEKGESDVRTADLTRLAELYGVSSDCLLGLADESEVQRVTPDELLLLRAFRFATPTEKRLLLAQAREIVSTGHERKSA